MHSQHDSPPWIRRGGCAIKKILRSHISSRRRGGWFNPPINRKLNQPPRPLLKRRLRDIFLAVASPLLVQGGESPLQTHTNRVLQMTIVLAFGIVLSQGVFAQSQPPAVRQVARGPVRVTVESYRTLASHYRVSTDRPCELGNFKATCRSSRGATALARETAMAFAGVSHVDCFTWISRRSPFGPKTVPPGPAAEPTIDDQLLLDAIDWAIKQNAIRPAPLFNKIDTTKIAVNGAVVRRPPGACRSLAIRVSRRRLSGTAERCPAGSNSPALKQSAGTKTA
jgi:hypothetical protein